LNSRLDFIRDWPALAKAAGYCSKTIAWQCAVSPRQLERYFQVNMGKPPHQWLRELRMRRAVELICDRTSLKQAAHELCYKDAAHFTRDFKEYFGVTPGRYTTAPAPSSISGQMSRFDNKCRI